MTFKRLFGLVAVMAALPACVSAPTNLKFQGRPNEAMLVLSTAPGETFQMYAFRRVDLASGKFVGGRDEIVIDNLVQYFLWDGVPNQLNYEDKDRHVSLVVHQLQPGDYALVETVSTADLGGRTFERTWICMFESAPVYEIRGGQTSIIRLDDVFSRRLRVRDSTIMKDYASATASYPGLQTEAQIVTPKAVVRWAKTEPGWFASGNCAEPESFTIRAEQPKSEAALVPAVSTGKAQQ